MIPGKVNIENRCVRLQCRAGGESRFVQEESDGEGSVFLPDIVPPRIQLRCLRSIRRLQGLDQLQSEMMRREVVEIVDSMLRETEQVRCFRLR